VEGEVENMDWIMGTYNGVMVCGVSVETMTVVMMMGVCAMGHVLIKTLRAMTEDEIEGVLDKSS